MAGQLSRQNVGSIELLRRAEVLQDVKGHRLDQSKGVILVTCADGDRFLDVFQYQAQMQAGCRADARIHTLSWHGGALACAPCSPVNRIRSASDVFLGQIADAREIKGINLIALYAHAPCSAAALHGVSLEKSFTLQMQAKGVIKTLNHGVELACFFHVDYGNGKKRTYFLSSSGWEVWVRENKIRAAIP